MWYKGRYGKDSARKRRYGKVGWFGLRHKGRHSKVGAKVGMVR